MSTHLLSKKLTSYKRRFQNNKCMSLFLVTTFSLLLVFFVSDWENNRRAFELFKSDHLLRSAVVDYNQIPAPGEDQRSLATIYAGHVSNIMSQIQDLKWDVPSRSENRASSSFSDDLVIKDEMKSNLKQADMKSGGKFSKKMKKLRKKEDMVLEFDGGLFKRKNKKNHYQDKQQFNFTRAWDDVNTSKEEEVLLQRGHALNEACSTLSKDTSRRFAEPPLEDVAGRMIWSKKYNFLWCPIFKAASTTLVDSLIRIKEVSRTEANTHRMARELYPMPKEDEERKLFMEKAMRLIVVRHPLDRILSAYRDKMLRKLRSQKDPYRQQQVSIFKQYADIKLPKALRRQKITPKFPQQPTFNQFLLKVKDDMARIHDSSKGKINMHWRPYWKICSPCTVKYSTILKVETFAPDQEYFILNRHLPPEDMLAKSHSSNFDMFNSTKEAREAYFRQVPRSLLKQIVALYEEDFRLFDYSPDLHMNLTYDDQIS